MNFALSGIIIIVLLLPGAVAQKSYYSALINKEAGIFIPFSDLLIQGIFWSFILHASFICILGLFHRHIDFHFLYDILIGKETKEFVFTDTQFSNYVRDFICYTISLSFIGFIAAKSLKSLARRFKWNTRYNGFKNFNYWFYIFSAEYSEGKRRFLNTQVDLIYVDVMISPEVIYCGILIDYNYSPEKDELENLILEGAKRRVVDKDNANIGSAVGIPGDIFIVNMKDVLNINVKYISITDNG